jgi:uncharacterized protein
MAVSLLDINVLVALAWPNHEHHARAHSWFTAHASEGWATCPLTQCGLIRISANPAIIANAVKPQDATMLLKRMIAHPHHVFWHDDISVDTSHIPWERVTGHRQIADAYLLGLAAKHDGRLATFDRGIFALARTPEERARVEVIS